MRLARLAATGLAIGVIGGFAVALLRPRPQVRVDVTDGPARADQLADEASTVLDMRTGRRVTG